MKNIVLIGMPGSGKSSVARAFAQKFSYKLVDSDELVQTLTSKKIADIFSMGESYFRNCEHKCLKKIIPGSKSIIALGGGVIVNEKNYPLIKNLGTVIYLFCRPSRIYNNLLGDYLRANITLNISSLKILFAYRHKLYVNICDWILDCSDLDIENTVQKISYFR